MQQIATHRDDIYNYFQGSASCQKFFFATAQEERYAAYYTSMYLLQDTTESLMAHRKNGFSFDPMKGYIEFWGVMQALIIQQESISELYEAVVGISLSTTNLSSWQLLRKFRNTCVGHPAKKDRPKSSPLSKAFMGREFGDYSNISYEQWQKGGGFATSTFSLGTIIDCYTTEADSVLAAVLQSMSRQWP